MTKFTLKIEGIAAKSRLFYRIAERYYRNAIHREIEIASITSVDRILCIGGGICPFSAILFHQITGASVTVVDNNSACIFRARKVIERLGLSEHISLQYRDGADVNVSGYTVIHLAKQVSPASRVFSEVKRRATDGTKLLVRTPNKRIGCTQLYIKGGAA